MRRSNTDQVQIDFATTGVIARRGKLELAWPEPHEYDLITNLRNSNGVARWFPQQQKYDLATNREWLAKGMQRGKEGLLAVREAATGTFLGTIGWTDLTDAPRSACFGRLMLDARTAVAIGIRTKAKEPSISAQAGIMLRDYAFEEMRMDFLTSWYFVNNRLSAKMNADIGLKPFGPRGSRELDGQLMETCELKLTRQDWLKLVGRA